MADYINNVAAADNYTAACTIGPDFAARYAVVTVANNPALMQFARGVVGNWRWTDEREFQSIPQSFRVGNVIGVRIRNALSGQVARVLVVLAGDDDPDFQSGMPFTGVLAANGTVTNPGGGAMQVIQDQLLTGTQASIDFLNIPQTFTHLMLVASLRDTAAATLIAAGLRFNADAGPNYDYEFQSSSAAAPAAFESFGQTSIRPGDYPGASAPAGVYGTLRVLIPNYVSTLYNKSCESSAAAKGGITTGLVRVQAAAGFWRSNAAITQLSLLSGSALFDVGSRATLYGLANA